MSVNIIHLQITQPILTKVSLSKILLGKTINFPVYYFDVSD